MTLCGIVRYLACANEGLVFVSLKLAVRRYCADVGSVESRAERQTSKRNRELKSQVGRQTLLC